MIGKWKTLSTKELFRTGFFRLRTDRCELPDGRVMPNYYSMEFPDWVNIIPLTPAGHVVMVEQYRHSSGEISLEIPGGGTHPGEHREDPQAAATRELLEETGYVPRDVRLVAAHRPNPAMQTNLMHTYIGYGCEKVSAQQLDPFEDINVIVLPVPEVVAKIMSGDINHSIIVASFMYALPALGYKL